MDIKHLASVVFHGAETAAGKAVPLLSVFNPAAGALVSSTLSFIMAAETAITGEKMGAVRKDFVLGNIAPLVIVLFQLLGKPVHDPAALNVAIGNLIDGLVLMIKGLPDIELALFGPAVPAKA